MDEFEFEVLSLIPNSISDCQICFSISGVYIFFFSVKGQRVDIFGMWSKLFNSTTVAGKQPQTVGKDTHPAPSSQVITRNESKKNPKTTTKPKEKPKQK